MWSYSNCQWHLDELFLRISGETHYLRRAVDHEGEVLEKYVTRRRYRKAALKLLRKSMKRYGHPHVIVTDRLRSYGVAMNVIEYAARQVTGRWFNNWVENSHLLFRRRERAMLRFRRIRSLQNSPLYILHLTTTSIRYAASRDETISSSIRPLLLPSGANFSRGKLMAFTIDWD